MKKQAKVTLLITVLAIIYAIWKIRTAGVLQWSQFVASGGLRNNISTLRLFGLSLPWNAEYFKVYSWIYLYILLLFTCISAYPIIYLRVWLRKRKGNVNNDEIVRKMYKTATYLTFIVIIMSLFFSVLFVKNVHDEHKAVIFSKANGAWTVAVMAMLNIFTFPLTKGTLLNRDYSFKKELVNVLKMMSLNKFTDKVSSENKKSSKKVWRTLWVGTAIYMIMWFNLQPKYIRIHFSKTFGSIHSGRWLDTIGTEYFTYFNFIAFAIILAYISLISVKAKNIWINVLNMATLSIATMLLILSLVIPSNWITDYASLSGVTREHTATIMNGNNAIMYMFIVLMLWVVFFLRIIACYFISKNTYDSLAISDEPVEQEEKNCREENSINIKKELN